MRFHCLCIFLSKELIDLSLFQAPKKTIGGLQQFCFCNRRRMGSMLRVDQPPCLQLCIHFSIHFCLNPRKPGPPCLQIAIPELLLGELASGCSHRTRRYELLHGFHGDRLMEANLGLDLPRDGIVPNVWNGRWMHHRHALLQEIAFLQHSFSPLPKQRSKVFRKFLSFHKLLKLVFDLRIL